MKLLKYRVTDFRSVQDSGWIEADQVTCLIGTNESGKTNLLLPLWKLNPARDGEIRQIDDHPRKAHSELKEAEEQPNFIRARFSVPPGLAQALAEKTEYPEDAMSEVEVARDFDGYYTIGFPNLEVPSMAVAELADRIEDLRKGLEAAHFDTSEQTKAQTRATKALEAAHRILDDQQNDVTELHAKSIAGALSRVSKKAVATLDTLGERYSTLRGDVEQLAEQITRPAPEDMDGVADLVLNRMPKFVYYSNYGNLDSEIYLPHVIANLERLPSLGPKEAARARTLRVLFDFVKLKPQEILELGKETLPAPAAPNRPIQQPTQDQIDADAEKKRQRTVLLQSAESRLTREFRDWWRQGEYTFRFAADGNHFRIWVSDRKRPEPIELESRSTGLQWFLSFFLTFLVESEEAHAGSILLLDEPGLTLHPVAQEDLSAFFHQLAQTSQILYTTHSPFMIDADHLDRVRAVYVDEDGLTRCSPDLRAQENKRDQARSVYAVDAALGLSVSRTMLLGSQPVIVEGASDQVYLTAMKAYLISQGLLKPPRELLFFPAGGVRGISKLVSILVGAKDDRPFVLLDGDAEGQRKAEDLRKGIYNDCKDRVLIVDEFTGLPGSEIEDLWPQSFLADRIAKLLRGPEEEFDDVVQQGQPIVPQVEAYAAKHGITLESPGWKVEVAKAAKRRLQGRPGLIAPVSSEAETWKRLFSLLVGST